MLCGGLGNSMRPEKTVADLLMQRMSATVGLFAATVIFTWMVANTHRQCFGNSPELYWRLLLNI